VLELVFKRYFWIFNLLALTAAAYFVARGGSAFVEAALTGGGEAAPATAPKAKPAPPKPPAAAPDKSDAVVLARNLFDSSAHPESAPAGPESGPAVATGEPAYCARPANKASGLTLVGLATATVPEYSLVAVRVGSDLKFGYLGDTIGDYHLSEVHTHWICLERGGALEYVNLFDTGAAAAAPAPVKPTDVPAGPTSASPDDSDKYIAKTGADEWSIDAGFLNDQIKNPAKLMTMGRAVPHLVDGKPEGFKLYAIRPSGLYYKLGVRNGDVIKSVNGTPLNSIDQALGLFNTLLEARDITLGVERRGAVVNLHYLIR